MSDLLEKQGVVQNVVDVNVNTKWGPKVTKRFTIDGEEYSGGFKKWSANAGDEVVITFEQTDKGYRNIKSLTVVAAGTGAAVPSTSAPKSNSGGGGGFRGGRSFPVEPLAPERTINRQNALTAAQRACGEIVDTIDIEKYMETVVRVARYFEAYTTGDLDKAEAEALASGEE